MVKYHGIIYNNKPISILPSSFPFLFFFTKSTKNYLSVKQSLYKSHWTIQSRDIRVSVRIRLVSDLISRKPWVISAGIRNDPCLWPKDRPRINVYIGADHKRIYLCNTLTCFYTLNFNSSVFSFSCVWCWVWEIVVFWLFRCFEMMMTWLCDVVYIMIVISWQVHYISLWLWVSYL